MIICVRTLGDEHNVHFALGPSLCPEHPVGYAGLHHPGSYGLDQVGAAVSHRAPLAFVGGREDQLSVASGGVRRPPMPGPCLKP